MNIKIKNLLAGAITILALLGCESSNDDIVKKYLPGTYTRETVPKNRANYYYKEITIKHLKGNEYRITCLDPDEIYYSLDKKVIITPRTPDVFDIEISSIQLKQESDSIKQYYIKGFVSNIVSNGTTFSDVENGINNTSIINLIIGKNIVELTFAGHNISSTRKK